MKPDVELPVIRACHESTVWLLPKIGKLPRDLRFTLGEKIERWMLDILALLICARYRRDRMQLFNDASIELEVLRHLLPIAHDLRTLPTRAYWDPARHLVQIGNWRNSGLRLAATALRLLPQGPNRAVYGPHGRAVVQSKAVRPVSRQWLRPKDAGAARGWSPMRTLRAA